MFRLSRADDKDYDAGVLEGPSPWFARDALSHMDALYRVARHLTGKDSDAEDLVQETYARALGHNERFVPGTNLRAWLLRILRNQFIDGFRRGKANPVSMNLEGEDPSVDPSVERDPLRGDAELELLRSVVARDIEAALDALPVDARAIVLLDLEGLTHEELSTVLDCPVGTVKSRLARARARLRERLVDYGR